MIISTCPVEYSEKIREKILKEKLAGCVLNIPMKESKYWWEGKLDCGEEDLLVFKTTEELMEKLFERLKELHPYDVPFIVEVDLDKVNEEYDKWLKEVMGD